MREFIAHYRILEKLGEGGMGEVWKAQDARLDRVVALKILPPDKTADAERKRRFVQEAKSASALQHPHIVTIYDIGSDDGLDYIAMEYVAGSTLEQAIGSKGLPVRQAVTWGIQIADALGRAHAKGIVHRDIKPNNVMVEDGGSVKVLDFGLSKLVEAPVSPEPVATVTMRDAVRTEEGKLVGTIAYMSPEQAEGRPVDARSDIFSFGALLYEMLSGRRPFTGESKLSVLAAILREDPASISTVSPGVPAELERIIARCLRKDPGRRYQHMDDVKIALEDFKQESESGTRLVAPGTRQRIWPWLAVAAVGLAGGGTFLWLRSRPPASPPAGPALKRLTYDSGLTTDAALSPDGRLIAYASDRGGNGGLDIWVQQLAGGDPTRITSSPEDEYEPVFSPDGTRIAYRSDAGGGGVYVVSALGGQPRLLVPGGRGPRYSPDGSLILFWKGNPTSGTPYANGAASIWVVPSQGGEARQLAADMSAAARPEWTADGRHVVFIGRPVQGTTAQVDFWVTALDGGASTRTGAHDAFTQAHLREAERYPALVRAAANQYVISLVSADSINLWRLTLAPPDWKARDVNRLTNGTQSELQPSLAGNRMAYNAETDSAQVWSVPLDANRGTVQGVPEQLTNGNEAWIPEVSRNGRKLAYLGVRPGEMRIIVRDLATGAESVAVSARRLHHPTISPDGTMVAYRKIDGKQAELLVAPSAGGTPQKLCGSDCGMTMSWTNDGRQVLFKMGAGIGLLDVASGVQTMLLEHGKDQLWQPQMSPDGKWIAFLMVHSSDRNSVNVAPFRQGVKSDEWITVLPAGAENDKPRWSPDGRMLYFTSTRDGYRCIWAQRLDAAKKPSGEPFPVQHYHSTVRSLSNLNLYELELSVVPGRLILLLGERRGNLWMTTLP